MARQHSFNYHHVDGRESVRSVIFNNCRPNATRQLIYGTIFIEEESVGEFKYHGWHKLDDFRKQHGIVLEVLS